MLVGGGVGTRAETGIGFCSNIGGVVDNVDVVVVDLLRLWNLLPSSDVAWLDEDDADEEGKCKLRSLLAVRGKDVVVVVAAVVVVDDSVFSIFRIP